MADTVIDLLGANGRRIGNAPGATLNAVSRCLAVGEWQLASPASAFTLATGMGAADVRGVRVVENGRPIFTGSVRSLPGDDSDGITIDGVVDPTVTLSGIDSGWGALAARRAYPDPATEAPWVTSHDVRSGVASTVAAAYIDANMGVTALAARQWDSLAIVDGAVGTSSTWTARLQRLDQLVTRICLDGGIVCRPTVDFDGTLSIRLAARADRTNRLVFSDRADLTSFVWRTRPATATYVITGGQGTLEARAFAVAAGAGTGNDRFEHYIDNTNLASTAELALNASARLAEAGEVRGLAVEIGRDAAETQRFGIDYDIGDLVSVEVDGTRFTTTIEAVRITVDENGSTVVPVLGTPARDAWTALVLSVADLRDQSNDAPN